MSRYLEQHGAKLLENGYSIVPIRRGYKFPKGLAKWESIKATKNHLTKWLSNGFADGGVGVLAKHTPGVDIDVLDEEIAQKLIEWCIENIGASVQRVGKAPKTLLVYQTDQPFSKVSSRTYEDMFGLRHKIEILGDGQQFVAYAEHPETGEPYTYSSRLELRDVPKKKLSKISIEQAQAFIKYFESLIPKDWEVVEKGEQGRLIDDDLSPDERALANLKPILGLSVDEIETTLSFIDPDIYGYGRWIKTLMAIYHETQGSDEGLAIAANWSQRGALYKDGEVEQKWPTFKSKINSSEPITFASVLKWAKENGMDEKKSKDKLKLFLNRYIYVEKGDMVCDLEKPAHVALSKIGEFRNRTANVRHEIPDPIKSDPDRTKLVPVHGTWMIHKKRKSAEGAKYCPDETAKVITDEHGLLWINEFYMPKFNYDSNEDGNLDVFFNHMDYLFPIEKERDWFIHWMAFNLQYPGKRCLVTPLHVSKQHGTGRGWVVKLLTRLLGAWNCKKTKMDVLCGEGGAGAFQDYLHKSLLCSVEEVRESSHRFGISDKVRDVLTEDYLEVNVKYGGKQTQRVYTNFFLMTNHVDALVLTEEDRRINVFSGPDFYQSQEYYKELYDWLDTDGLSQLHQYLMSLHLSDFNYTRNMETEARSKMIESNRNDTERLFWDFMESPRYPALTQEQIIKEMLNLCEGDPFEQDINRSQLTKLLQEHAEGPHRMRIEGKIRRVWDVAKTRDDKKMKESVEECGL